MSDPKPTQAEIERRLRAEGAYGDPVLRDRTRASEGYSALESEIESVVRQHIKRGTVQVNLRVDRIGAGSAYRINDAVLDLEASQERNENRSLFRSRLLLDEDRAVRSANLAAIYRDAGMFDSQRPRGLEGGDCGLCELLRSPFPGEQL